MTTPADYPAQFEAWKTRRLAALKAPNGWLNIIGRTWLEPGTVTVGSDPDSGIVLSAGPASLGTLTQHDNGEVDFVPADGSAPHHLVPNKKHPPHFLLNGLYVEVTTINGDNALRVRDTNSTAPDELEPLRYFPLDPDWRIEAKWVPYEAPRGLTVNTTKGIETEVEVTHKAVFEKDGRTFELIATHGTPEMPQFVIRDLTPTRRAASSMARTSPTTPSSSTSTRPSTRPAPSPNTPSARCHQRKTSCRSASKPAKNASPYSTDPAGSAVPLKPIAPQRPPPPLRGR